MQGEAIAYNLREMFGLRVPVISVVIGEGGSGGALAIGCANKNIIMENAVYYVASPEACAAILWKSRAASSQVRHDGQQAGVGAAGTLIFFASLHAGLRCNTTSSTVVESFLALSSLVAQ